MPMLLEILHSTRYQYTGPIRETLMELRMQPRSVQRQRLVFFEAVTTPRARLFTYTDWLGNQVHHFDVPDEHTELSIEARAIVEVDDPDVLPAKMGQPEWDRFGHSEVGNRFADFMSWSSFVRPSSALTLFCAELDIARQACPLESLIDLNGKLYRAFDYESGITNAESPIEAVLHERRGVCQDFAHVMLTICRGWGIPARYVSGYLKPSDRRQERSTPDATHAWVECWLPSLGRWVGFDPTNDSLANHNHISVAVGRDYRDVAPSRGVYKGDASNDISVSVQVRPTAHLRPVLEIPAHARPAKVPPVRKRTNAADLLARQQQQQQQQQQQ